MAQADRAVPAKRRARAGSDRPPPFQPPQLATLVDAVPTGNGWMHEIKYDGYRRSEEHTSELQSLMRISYAVFCLKKKKKRQQKSNNDHNTSNITQSRNTYSL